MANEEEARKILKSMKIASETVRSAIADAIPVATNQILTVAVPGTMINYQDFYYEADQHIKPPLAVQVQEARLVDGMIPLSKFTAGKTGKSVARSYLATLDLLVPVEASVSGAVGSSSTTVTDERLRVIRDRYKAAMDYLRSPDDTPTANGRSKVDTYVMKQAAWAKEVAAYTQAQGQALRDSNPPTGATSAQIKEAREKYMQWLQEHARDYKNNIQTKYMDWVVHGYKFMVDYNFGIVDIASGMKRIENSKEAFRNLSLIAADGASEYQTVVLSPSNWATIVRDKEVNWAKRNDKPTAAEIRAELRRLHNLLVSHQTLMDGITDDAFFPVISANNGVDDVELKKAFADVYSSIDKRNSETLKDGRAVKTENSNKWLDRYKTAAPKPEQPPEKEEDPFQKLIAAQNAWSEKSLSRNTVAVRADLEGTDAKAIKDAASGWLNARISQIQRNIKALEEQLNSLSAETQQGNNKLLTLPVVNGDGTVVTPDEMVVDPGLLGKKPVVDAEAAGQADKWTKISCKASSKTDIKETETSQSASSIAFKAGWGLFSASGGASHSQSSAKAMSSMSNLEVNITMDCMLVEIDRPWLHAELFVDAELDSGKFDISPGEAELKNMYEKEITPAGYFQQFSSYPTAFIVAADVELNFSGDTTHLESAVSASSTSASVNVGYGPFKLSASHSQSKSKSKTKMESTSTGCKISIQAPQIVAWVQTLLPQLPKPRDGRSTMVGLFN